MNAKQLLTTCKNPESWFGVKYTMNIYRGCEHQCIYCDSRSECYCIENFNDIIVKINSIELLRRELCRKRIKGTIGTGAMSDPYTHVEKEYNLTGQALEVIAEFGFPVNIITKSDMIIKDIEFLKEINKIYASVVFTITTTNDTLAQKLEPGAPSPSRRLKAMRLLSSAGIRTGVTMMPVLPFIEDNIGNINSIVEKSAESGAKFIIPWFGMSLRDRQRSYYYNKLDRLFPGLRQKYEITYDSGYSCLSGNLDSLKQAFDDKCKGLGISMEMPSYTPKEPLAQLSLFD